MKRVLVTGASGFVGRHVLDPLRERGYDVHAVGRRGRFGVAEWHSADLLDPIARRGLLREVKPSHLLHLAWYAEPGTYWRSPLNLDHAAAAVCLLREFSEQGGSRFVGAGTCAEYAWRGGILTEGVTPLAPATLYGAAKLSVQQLAAAFSSESGVSVAWGRLFFLYGPHEHPGRLVPSIIRAVLAGSPARCSPGTQQRDFLFVEDAADALAALLDSGLSGPVNIGSGESVAVADIARQIGVLLDARMLILLGALPPVQEPEVLVADVRRLRDELGWTPRRDLEAGLARTIDWWRSRMGASPDVREDDATGVDD